MISGQLIQGLHHHGQAHPEHHQAPKPQEQDHSHHHGHDHDQFDPVPPPGGHMGTHGMLVFGKHYFSHIPMFHKPHDYQILLDVEMKHESLPPGKDYGHELHTFVPAPFSLGDLLNGKIHELEGTLYQGNFEGDGKPICDHVKVDVKQILSSKHLEADSQGSKELNYVVYGDQQDAYLIHPIAGNAGFDQLLSIDPSGLGLSDGQLAQGVPLQMPDRPNDIDHRLRAQETHVSAQGPNGPVQFSVEKELSCLVGPHFTEGPKN